MAGLLYKELILGRKSLIMLGCVVFIYPIAMLLAMSNGEDDMDIEKFMPLFLIALYLFIFFFVGMFQPNIFETDENKKWAYFITSTPAMAELQIGAKYLFGFLMSFLAMIWCNTLNVITNEAYHLNNSIVSVSTVMLFIQLFLRAFEFPFMVRFGSKAGGRYKIAVFFIFMFILFVYFLFGDLSIFGSTDKFYDKILSLFSGEGFSDTQLFILSLCPYISTALYYISYRISCRLYLKGAEEFDN